MATWLSRRVPNSNATIPQHIRILAFNSADSGSKYRHSIRHNSTANINFRENIVEPPTRPLSALPIGALLRSLLIATVSSKPYLLYPSLSVLSFLSKPGRSLPFNVDRNPLLRWILKPTFYSQFCGGENRVEVQELTANMKRVGFSGTIVTYAKETVFDHRDQAEYGTDISMSERSQSEKCSGIETWRNGTLETIDMLREGDQLALKLTGAGPRVTSAFTAGDLPPQQMLDALNDICIAGRKQKIRLLIDAESQHFQRGISRVNLELMRKYNKDGYALVYHTYQAYLKQTPAQLARHLALAVEEGWTFGLKLVRGAYMATDERSLIHDKKEDTDQLFNSIAQGALRQEIGEFGKSRPFPQFELLLATHNMQSALEAHQLHRERVVAGLPTVPVYFAQLQGMSDKVSFSLLQLRNENGEPPKVLKYTTWGSVGECLAYLTRRALENRDAVARTQDEFKALKKELRRRLWSYSNSI